MQLLLISPCLIGRPRPSGFLTAHKAGRLKLLPFAGLLLTTGGQERANIYKLGPFALLAGQNI